MAKTKTTLNPELLSKIKDMLLREKINLQEQLSAFAKKNPHITGDYDTVMADYGDKEDENAQEVAEFTANKPLEISLEKTLRDIQKSLERIERGTYGVCKYCDQIIDEKRLLARPTSSACVSCKKTLTDEV
jgi:RNA polymerase-binding transcription factor DksA